MRKKTIVAFFSMLTIGIQALASDVGGDTRVEERARITSSKVLNLTECFDNKLDRWATISFHVLSENTVEKYLVSVNKRCSLGLANCSITETFIANSSRSSKVVENNEIKFSYDLRTPEEREPAMKKCMIERNKYLYQYQAQSK